MRRFLAKLLLLALVVVILAVALALCAYRSPPPKRFGYEVFHAIAVCTAHQPQATMLVLGDSVANQLFASGPSMPPEVAVATCNQAVMPIGNRILLDAWLAHNPQTKDVVYVLTPASLANDGTRQFTFHYFIHPFAETGLLKAATQEVRNHLEARFGALVLRNESLRHLLYLNDRLYEYYEQYIVQPSPPAPLGRIPGIIVAELRAMRDACAGRGVHFHLAFPPVSASHAPSATFRANCTDSLRQDFLEIDDLFATLRVEPDAFFRDGIHFTSERLAEIRETVRASLLFSSGMESDGVDANAPR